MTTYPVLAKVGSSLPMPQPQQIQHSLYGLKAGISATDTFVGPNGFPLRPEGGTVITATTADVIGNFGEYKLSSSNVSAVFTLADPAPGARVRMTFACTPATSVKLTSVSSAVLFGGLASSTSFALTITSSLFFDNTYVELRGESTSAYRLVGYVNTYGSTILPTYTTG